MFKLVAEAYKQKYNGVVASRTFETREEAEKVMRQWGRFGVENLCDEADRIRIYDADDAVVSTWSKRLRQPV